MEGFEKLDAGTTLYILDRLQTPDDLARAECVCRTWHTYVRSGSHLWKHMVVKIFPELSDNIQCICANKKCFVDLRCNHIQSEAFESRSLYSELLSQLLRQPIQKTCVCGPLHASSTDNFPQESIAQTLYPDSMYPDEEGPSYWSSKGEINTDIPETLTYRLISDICVVHEVKIQPFKAYFQPGEPIYSSQKVRFRFGYSKSINSRWRGLLSWLSDIPTKFNLNDCVWTYESPAFPMAQDDTLQSFKLPRPTLCLGGLIQIEFIGRVQTQQLDNLYYICIASVHVSGYPVSDFSVNISDNGGQYTLKHLCQTENGVGGSVISSLSRHIKLPLTGLRRSRVLNHPLQNIFLENLRLAGQEEFST